MLKHKKNIVILVFIFLSLLGPLLYIYGLGFSPAFRDIRSKPRFLFLISPLPLLFDRKDFFINPEIQFFMKDKKQINIRFNKDLISNLDGDPHRKLHIMRLFAFYYFFSKHDWYAGVKYFGCNPEKLNLKIDKDQILSIKVLGYYKNDDKKEPYFESEKIECNI